MKNLAFIILISLFAVGCSSTRLTEEFKSAAMETSETYYGKVIDVAPRSMLPSPYKNAFVYADSGIVILYGNYEKIKEGDDIWIQEEPQTNHYSISTFAVIRGERYPIRK